jgi:ribulose-bisphosphate carboxylase large chain
MSVSRVPEMLDFYGRDVMLLIGGALLASEDLPAAAATFANAVVQKSETQ